MSSSDVLRRLTTHSTAVRIGFVAMILLVLAATGMATALCPPNCPI